MRIADMANCSCRLPSSQVQKDICIHGQETGISAPFYFRYVLDFFLRPTISINLNKTVIAVSTFRCGQSTRIISTQNSGNCILDFDYFFSFVLRGFTGSRIFSLLLRHYNTELIWTRTALAIRLLVSLSRFR